MSTLINTNPRSLINASKIGLFNNNGGAYSVERYPWAYESWQKQQQIHWLGEEVPLNDDVTDWNNNNLTENERNLLMQIFRFFTQADIDVGSNYINNYLPLFQPLEIKMMLASFTNVETIHIDAYALLLKTLNIPDSEFLAFKDYEAMRKKNEYNLSFNADTMGDLLRTMAMMGAFNEGLSLYASFGMLMNFPRHKKMRGMGQIVTWSIRDESLHCESMIRLFHELNNETGLMNQSIADDITDIADVMVQLEDKFIELSFEMGDIEGMTPQDIKAYIRFVADWRLCQLKLTPKYGYFDKKDGAYIQLQDHPLPWLVEILNGVEHANFFEARATEYSKVATDGEWFGVNGAWNNFDSINSN